MKKSGPLDLTKLSRKTGLVVRLVDSESLNRLFAELEKYDTQERVETFEYFGARAERDSRFPRRKTYLHD